MSFVSEYFTPLLKQYHNLIEGKYLSHQLRYKGSRGEVGGNYINKVNRANKKAVQQKYEQALVRVKQPTFSGFVQDNLLRLLFNPFDRLITTFQAYPTLKIRFSKPGTFSHTFTQILNEGFFYGGFKGLILNFAQFGLVLYPSVLAANKNQDKYVTFLSTYTFLDAVLYPLDTLKSILYADTVGRFSLKNVAHSTTISGLYQGILLKLAYNVPVLSGIYLTSQTGYEYHALATWALAALLYPLSTEKVRRQLSGTSISTVNSRTNAIAHSHYRGVAPYILLNALIGYSLRPLYSESKLAQIKKQVKDQLKSLGYD